MWFHVCTDLSRTCTMWNQKFRRQVGMYSYRCLMVIGMYTVVIFRTGYAAKEDRCS